MTTLSLINGDCFRQVLVDNLITKYTVSWHLVNN